MSDFMLNAAIPCDYEWEVSENGFPTFFVVPQGDPQRPGEVGLPGFTLDFDAIQEAIEDDLADPDPSDLSEWLDLSQGLATLSRFIRNKVQEFYVQCD